MNLLKISNSIYRCEFPNEYVINGVMIKINVWLVVSQDDVYIIDTGLDYMTTEIISHAKALGNPKALFITHGHIEHISGVHQIVKRFDIPVYTERLEIDAIGRGLVPYPNKKHQLVSYFKEFDDSVLEKAGLKIYVTPGYSPGHTIFHHEKDNVLIAVRLSMSLNRI